jgi:hypothetical protein
VKPELALETEKLARSWDQYEAGWLRDYLVAGVEDPRLNLQSIVSRHFLLDAIMPGRFAGLMRQEYRFAATMQWLLSRPELGNDAEGRSAVLYALRRGADNAEGLEIPGFIVQTFAHLPAQTDGWIVPNYLEMYLAETGGESEPASRNAAVVDTFALGWQEVLQQHSGSRAVTATAKQRGDHGLSGATCENAKPRGLPSLVEPACGSANDYRFLQRYGLARFFDYTGFDLCQKNVENALQLFPKACFQTGNVFEISASSKSFDFCIVHDLFEHLSLAGLEQAVAEICRVTRVGMCLGFFQMDEIPEHVVRPREEYHWNLLSLRRTKALFATHGFAAQAIHLGAFLAHHTGWQQTHNPNAYAFIVRANDAGRTWPASS